LPAIQNVLLRYCAFHVYRHQFLYKEPRSEKQYRHRPGGGDPAKIYLELTRCSRGLQHSPTCFSIITVQGCNMTNSILVPLDDSPTSEAALPLAMAIAHATRASVELVHVHELAPLAGMAPAFDTALDIDEAQHMRERIEALAERLTLAHGVPVSTTLLIGPVVPTIEQHAVDRQTGLIVMTTHGRGGLSRAWLGSVADQLIRARTAPVLLVRPDSDRPQKVKWPPARVLVPLDSTPLSEEVLAPLAELIRPDRTEFVLLRVVEPFPPLEPFPDVAVMFDRTGTQSAVDAATAEQVKAAEYGLEGIAERLRRSGMRVRVHVAVHSSAARAVLEYANETGVDLVALATHGRGAIARAFMGSVADEVMRGASMPVLIVPPPRTAAAAETD
jgi:nucleotide-binding universal stress UspA family protein